MVLLSDIQVPFMTKVLEKAAKAEKAISELRSNLICEDTKQMSAAKLLVRWKKSFKSDARQKKSFFPYSEWKIKESIEAVKPTTIQLFNRILAAF